MKDIKISVIIPISVKTSSEWLIDRLHFPLSDKAISSKIEFIYVDYGSSSQQSKKIKSFCETENCKYIKVDTADQILSFSSARNTGASIATGDYLLFLDVDLVTYDGFYNLLLTEIETIREYEDYNECAFIMLPVIYLTETGTQKFFHINSSIRKNYFMEDLYDKGLCTERYSTGTSAIVVSRYTFCTLGGFPEEFLGWGGEDIVFNNRLIRAWAKYPIPKDYSHDIGSMHGINIYKGWKAMYRLHGDRSFHKGLFLFHAWHPVNLSSTYKDLWKKNKIIMDEKIAEAKRPWTAPPLPYNNKKSTLIIDQNSFTANTQILPFWGKWKALDKNKLKSSKEVISYFQDSDFDKIVFHNPYKSDFHRKIYEEARSLNLNYTVCERGALNESIFYDKNGFNYDSKSYFIDQWNNPLTLEEEEKLSQYIAFDKKSFSALEPQGKYEISDYRTRRGISRHKKILFIPLQRFTDTVTREFKGAWKNYFEFVQNIIRSAPYFSSDWVLVVKPHPLEDIIPTIPGAIIENEAHFKEILLSSDAVYTLNSGVGVYGLMYDKPVYVSGDAFYNGSGLATKVDSITDILDFNLAIDPEPRRRFINHLIHKFYSFGKQTTRNVLDDQGFRMTATTHIDLYQVIVDDSCKKISPAKIRTPESSLLFDRYLDKRTPILNNSHQTKTLVNTQPKTKKNEKIVEFPAASFRIIQGAIFGKMVLLENNLQASLIYSTMDEISEETRNISIILHSEEADAIEFEVNQNGLSVISNIAYQNHRTIVTCKIHCYLPIVIRSKLNINSKVIIENIIDSSQNLEKSLLNNDAFDELYYLQKNPDVKHAIEEGSISSAFSHFQQFGIFELREYRLKTKKRFIKA